MSEKALWKWLRGVLPRGHYTRIESPDTAAGFPDVCYTYDSHTGTLELKFSKHPGALRPFKRDGLRKSQIDWINDEVVAGGTVWIVGQVKDQVFFHCGVYADDYNDFTRNQLKKKAALILPRYKLTGGHLEQLAFRLKGYV